MLLFVQVNVEVFKSDLEKCANNSLRDLKEKILEELRQIEKFLK